MENRINEKQYPESKNLVEKSRRALKPQSGGLFADRAPFILACLPTASFQSGTWKERCYYADISHDLPLKHYSFSTLWDMQLL